MPWGRIAFALGGATTIALVIWIGAAAIGQEVLRAGWAIPPIVLLHLVQEYLSAAAWRMTVDAPRPDRAPYLRFHVIRAAVNGLLPVAHLGGNIVAVRLLMRRGVPGTDATAGTTIDVTLEAVSQLLFTLFGVAILAATVDDHAWLPGVLAGMAAMAVGIAGFILVQRIGGLRIVERLAGPLIRIFPRLSIETLRTLHQALLRRQRQRGMLLRATLLHLAAWLLGIGETWLALEAMGRPTSLAEALVIESLGMAVRSAGFAVPAGLGVQEAGFIVVGTLFGVPADQAVALSMVKRLRELLIGVPGLVLWQWEETRRVPKAK